MLWQAQRIDQAAKHHGDQHQQRMFQTPIQQVSLVELPSLPVEDAFDAMELLGFPLINPFELIADSTEAALLAKDLPNHIGKVVSVYGYLVTIKNTSTIHRDRMLFGTFLDREGHFVDDSLPRNHKTLSCTRTRYLSPYGQSRRRIWRHKY